MLLRRCAFPLALVALLIGCGSNDIKDEDLFAPADLVKFEPELKLKKRWSASVGNGQGKSYTKLAPALAGDYIYVAAYNGHVLCVEQESGKKRWLQKTKLPITGGVGAAYDQVFVGTENGQVVAMAAEDGAILWSTQLSSEVLSAPQSDGDIVVVPSYDGKLYGLNFETGKKVWEYDSSLPVLTLRGTANPVVDGETVIAAFANGKLVAFDIATGLVRWEQRVAISQGRSEIERIVDIDGTPLLDAPLIYAVSYQGRLVAMESGSGRPLWRKEASSFVGLAEGFGNVYVAEANGKVGAYTSQEGTLRWQQEELAWRKLSAPATMSSYVAVSDYDGYVHLLSQVDGHMVARTRVDSSGVRAPLLAYDDTLLVYGNSGKLVALGIQKD
ncbi:MAG: outer membrane protein assembly factor BamB [Pseudomonadales bacterium]